MADFISMLAGAAGGGAEETDPDFKQTVLLLHGDGTNGAQNNTFVDSSTNNFTITRNGNTTQGTFSPFSVAEGQWSNYFDGSGDYLSMAPGAIGTGDFTLECWVYFNSLGTNQGVLDTRSDSNTNGFALVGRSTGEVSMADGTSLIGTATSVSANTWIHIAASRASGVLSFYVNGTRSGGTLSNTTNFSNNRLRVGAIGSAGENLGGYVSNARLLNTAIYSGTTIIVPSAPFSDDANTTALLCQSNRFIDNATPASTITVTGNTSVQPFSPFAPTAAYDPSVNGGSGYFDGTGDYLSVPDDADLTLTGDFTIECWAYAASTSVTDSLIGKWGTLPNQEYLLWLASGTPDFYFAPYSIATPLLSSSKTITTNSWNHICVTRSSNSFTMYLNGESVATATNSGTFTNTTSPVDIGSLSDYVGYDYTGYIAGVRLIKGGVQTPPAGGPTSPPTAVSGTELLCNFTNAGIFDNTGKNNLETVGNAQIDTTTKKYGTGSMEFDGTGDWLIAPNTPDQQLGTGNFTIEFWVYLASGDTGSNRGLVAKGTSTTGFLVSLNTTEKVVFTYATSTITSSGAITTNAWNHIAVVREGTGSNQTKIYIGGTNDGTGTVSTDFNQTSVMYVGANRTGGDPMKGFIDDLRITKGIARYTATFTPPTKAFFDL